MSTVDTVAQKNENPVKIYVDFDGTISKSDIINFLLERYADPVWLQLDKDYIEEKISSSECLTKQIALLEKLPDEKILESAKMVGIDETFKDFCRFCESKNIDIEIVSDGLDIYIDYLLKANNINVKKVSSNIYKGYGQIEFPYNEKLCEKNCANCKKFHLDPKSFCIYIGDGYNDGCAAVSANIVFAKNSLAKFLNNKGKDFFPFKSFTDIITILSKFLSERT
jgi:2,3-diketo-5-methylthio-1-phosphopentane phosphatase